MRYQHKLKSSLIWICILSLVLTVIFSYLQYRYTELIYFSIINNISICILTGTIIALIQTCIGYNNAKREALLLFYKNALVLEKKLYVISIKEIGFNSPQKGFEEINEITNYFTDEFKFSYELIYKHKKSDTEFQAAINIFRIYYGICKKYFAMEEALENAISYIELSDEKISAKGINEAIETKKHNDILKTKYEDIAKEINNSEKIKSLSKNLDVLERYLFDKKH